MKISVVVPVFNEQAVIGQFIEATMAVLEQHCPEHELILVDDGSRDNTLAICRDFVATTPAIQVLVFSRNYGHEAASTAGLEHASGDYVILMDADLQHPPQLIPELIEKAKQGYDVVHAARQNRDTDSWIKTKLSNLFYSLSKKMTGFDIQQDIGNYRIMHRKVVDSIIQMRESNRHMLMLFAYVGFHSTSIPYTCQERAAGDSKYSYRKLINLALDSIISFSHRPLRYMSILCVMISFFTFCYAGFILFEKLFWHQTLAEGVASVIFMTASLFSVLFLFLAVLSEYITRILVESKQRPLYYIREVIRG